jgi:ABC-type oligopeptide transport system substrate-binding subunit
MPTKLVLATVMAAVAASLLVASAMAGGSAASAKGGTLRVNHSLSDYEYVDPQKCYDTGCSEILWPTMYNLMQYPEKNGAEGKRVYPEAATGQPVVSKDGKTYTFTIRAGHKASNGKTVTGQWFVHAFERLLSPKMGDAASARFGGVSVLAPVQGAQAFYDGKAQRISGVTASGNKLTIKLTKPFPSLVSALAMNWFTATDPATPYSEQDVNTVVGSGPYYISSREVGRTLVLDRNRNYKGSRPANPDRIVVTVGGESNQSILQVKAGQADYEPIVPSAAAGALAEEFGLNKGRFFVKPTSVTSYWALNSLAGQPLNNVKLRQAINWAIDRPAQVRVAGKFGGRRTSQILPPAMPGFLKSNNIYAYNGANVAKAKAVAGDVSNVPTIRIVHSNSTANINRGQIMRFNLESMGLKARTEPIPSAQLFSRAGDKKGNYDVLAIGWQADYPDPSNFINVLLDGRNIPNEGSSNNSALFNSPKFNKLMDQAALLAGDARFAAYGRLDVQIMKEAAPWAPYINSNNRMLVSGRISNVIYNEANTNVALNALVIK